MADKLFVLPELELCVMFHVKHHAAVLSPADTLLVVAGGRGPKTEWLHSISSGCTALAAARKFTAPTVALNTALQ